MLEDLWSGLIHFTEPFVVPDWGSLIGLLPLGLAAAVVLYLSWTTYRFATAAPTRRGIQRLTPVAPAGLHMPGPSFAPVLAAFGFFMLVFGVVTGGLWLWVGLVILVITLLYWGREALHDYDHVASPPEAHAAIAAPTADALPGPGALPRPGALPAPRGGIPPAGVHVPPPSFRPLLVAVSLTILVAGLVIGGWALLFGVVAVALTLLGWLRDARREYVAVSVADATGHLDLGGAPAWPKATFAALALIIAGALLLTSGVLPNSGGGTTPAPSGGQPGGSAGGGTPAPSLPAADVTISAKNIAFSTNAITIPAGKPFTLAFDNQEAVLHNVEIKDAGGAVLFKGETFTGPKVVIYKVPAIPAGEYTFLCIVHANMTGTVTAK